MKADEVLDYVKGVIAQRGEQRDLTSGERTIPRCVAAFNSVKGKRVLTNEDGWMFMEILKLCRMQDGKFVFDDYADNCGYAALLAEEALKTQKDNEAWEKTTKTLYEDVMEIE